MLCESLLIMHTVGHAHKGHLKEGRDDPGGEGGSGTR